MEVEIKLRIVAFLTAAALIAVSVLGGRDGLDGVSNDGNLLQKSVSAASLIYAVFGMAAGIGVLLRRRWGFPLAILWGLAATYAGSVATFAWREPGQPVLVSVVAALAGSLIICGLVVWGAHVATRAR